MKPKPTHIAKEFPERLKQLRLYKGWSQGQVALKIGTDVNRISKYERGVFSPTTDMVIKLADLFEVSVDYLIRQDNTMKASSIQNPQLIRYMEEIDQLSESEQTIVINFLDAYVKRKRFEELMLS
jgi:transcriptional regulator with XRE-family HTH domain